LKNSDSKDLIVILQENKQIGNQKAIKDLKLKIEEYPIMKGNILVSWIKKQAEELGVKLDKEVINILAVAFDGETGCIFNELEKLVLMDGEINVKTFLNLTVLPNNPIDFELSNAIGDKNKKLALKALYKEIEANKVPVMIFGSIIYQMRNLLILKMAEGNRGINLKNSGLHPFVISKTRGLVRKFSLEELQRAYKKLFQYDVAAKKGKIDLLLALELFINEFTK
jgi:DNA polymerase-3 subunit delta